MKKIMLTILVTISLVFTGCSMVTNGNTPTDNQGVGANKGKDNDDSPKLLNKSASTIKTRYNPSEGFTRVELEGKDFGIFLRDRELLPYDDKRHLDGVYDSILDIEIDPENVHQSSVMMLLRAEYLYSQKRYKEISFNFESGFVAEYDQWVQGNRLDKQGGVVRWVQRDSASNTHDDLMNYMNAVFKYSGGLSIEKYLQPKELDKIAIGDVFIRGGGLGQVVMVVDMAHNKETGEKQIMLLQTDFTTKETSILINPNNPELSTWYDLDIDEGLVTSIGKFVKSDLKTFE